MKPLTERERRFIDAYMGKAAGNGAEAARLAGYKGSPLVRSIQGSRMLKKTYIQEALAAQRQVLSSQSIADAKERREVLTSILREPKDPNARIRAIDVHNKMDGLYIEKHEHSGADGQPIRTIVHHYAVPQKLLNS